MRVLVIVSILCVHFSFAQQWKDSLAHANKSYQSGDYSGAFSKFLSAQRLAPNSVDLSKDIGVAAYRSGDFETATRAFETAAKRAATTADAARKWHNIGNSQLKQENYAAAIESYKKSLRLAPQDEQTRYNLAQAQRRLIAQHQQEKKQQDQQENDGQQQDPSDQQNNSANQDQQDEPSTEQQEQNQEQNEGSKEDQEEAMQQQFSAKRTEKLLDELLKKEMETKKKMQGRNKDGKSEQVESGKRW